MTHDDPERLGRLDDEQEAAEESSTTDGAAARGESDPAEGSVGRPHPVGEDYPDEAVRYDDRDERPRSETGEG
jgi:hypothetical protein